MSDATPALSETEALRADIYHLLASLLRQAPDDELHHWLATLEVEQDGSRLVECWQALVIAARNTSPDMLHRDHFRHLVGVIQGDVVPYASWYRNGELMEAALVSLRRDLRLLGFERCDSTHEPEDHLAAICEVMAMLVASQSQEQAGFFQRHLAPWARHCFSDLAQVDSVFYIALGQLGDAFMESEQARIGNQTMGSQPIRMMEP